MPITGSVIVEDAAQKDLRRAITEAHTDQVGIVRLVKYLAASGADVSAAWSNGLWACSEIGNRTRSNPLFRIGNRYHVND